MQNRIAFLNIIQVRFRFCFPSVQVMHSMVAHRMTMLNYFMIECSIFFNVSANTKKSRFSIVLMQLLQNPWSYLCRAIIKREVQNLFGSIYSENNSREY